MSMWFTADLHLGHRLVSELRGFATTEAHDEAVLDSLGRAVRPGDQLWILGDLSSGSNAREERALDLLAEYVAAPMHLIAGNHDSAHPQHRDAHKRQRRFLEVFASVQPYARRKLAGRRLLLSHYPYRADHTAAPRDVQWRLPDLGDWLLHGHTHSDVRLRGRELCVGLEAWGMKPVSIDQIAAIFEDRSAA